MAKKFWKRNLKKGAQKKKRRDENNARERW